jgi:hypothetical protein
MKKDYKKILKGLYMPKLGVPGIVEVPRMSFLMVSGKGHPSDQEFGQAAGTVFAVSYVSKFVLKEKRPDEDFTVMPMEVKWRLDRSKHGSKRYSWTMMVMQPTGITESVLKEALERLARKKKTPPLAGRLRLESCGGSPCGQILHVGPYGGPMEETFAVLTRHLSAAGYAWEPDSLDVYFNDIRRCAPEKLRTLTRVRAWPVEGPTPVLEDPFRPWE